MPELRDWGPDDDPCAILEGRRFRADAGCTNVWFENGWLHYGGEPHYGANGRYECHSEGSVAKIRQCFLWEPGPYEFDRDTGVLTLRGFPVWRSVASNWQEHSGTYLDYGFYHSEYGYTSCEPDHTGLP